MRIPIFIQQLLRHMLCGMTVELPYTVVNVVRRFWEGIEAFIVRLKLPHSAKNANSNCSTVSHPSFQHPDLRIYDQFYLVKLGLPVTWDNPDIVLPFNVNTFADEVFAGGAETVGSHDDPQNDWVLHTLIDGCQSIVLV